MVKSRFAFRLDTDIPSQFLFLSLYFLSLCFRDPANNSEFQYKWNILQSSYMV